MGISIYDILALREDGEENNAPVSSEDVANDDFSIDTSLDDGGEPADVGASPDQGSAEEDMTGDDMGDQEAPEGSEEQPEDGGDDGVNSNNTNIFTSLTAEEQQTKMKELKRLFSELYTSCNEILDKVNNIDANEKYIGTISRISSTVYDMKKYIADYMVFVFPQKSYVENDITFNRFLLIIKSISEILEKVSKEQDKEEEKDISHE